MDEIKWSDMREILERAPDESDRWTLQGFGMLRYYVSETLRLHVWSPYHATPGVSQIHTHPWHFTSRVLCGILTDILYGTRGPGFASWCQQIQCGEGGGLIGEPERVTLHTTDLQRYALGQTYRRFAEQIHESQPQAGTVTLCERQFLPDTEHAFVYWQDGAEWGDAEPRPATVDEIRDITGKALEIWGK